jgi:hypothetical protein
VGRAIIDLPFWVWFVYFDVAFWFLTAPAAIILMIIGWRGAGGFRGLRRVAFGAAALLAIPFPIAATFIVIGEINAAANLAALHRTLDRDETVAGMALPAGTRILFRDKAHMGIASIDLPGAVNIRGMRLAGTVAWNDYSQVWSATLAEDQGLDGWPCRAGSIEFDKDGTVQECELTKTYELLEFALPPGTDVRRGTDGKPWALRLPEDAGLAMPALSTMAPPGVTLLVTSNGRLENMSSGHGQTIVVRGVPLNSMNLSLRGDQVVAALAAPFMVDGEMRPAATGVQVDLPSGGIVLARKNWWLSE